MEPLQLPPSPYRTPTEVSGINKATRAASMNDVDGDQCVHARFELFFSFALMMS